MHSLPEPSLYPQEPSHYSQAPLLYPIKTSLSSLFGVVKQKEANNMRVRMDLNPASLQMKLRIAAARALVQMEEEKRSSKYERGSKPFRFFTAKDREDDCPLSKEEDNQLVIDERSESEAATAAQGAVDEIFQSTDVPFITEPKAFSFLDVDIELVSDFESDCESELKELTSGIVGDYPFAMASMRGRRPAMEDAHLACSVVIDIKSVSYDVPLFGLFDGHGGAEAAKFVKKHLPDQLKHALEEFNEDGITDLGVWNALKISCARLHEQFRVEKKIVDLSGTTATFCVILEGKLWTANVGDSRIVLEDRLLGTIQLTEDAKPGDRKYLQNILDRDGSVIRLTYPDCVIDRINESLAVGRAIGDYDCFLEKPVAKGINPRPTITMRPLSEIASGSYLILGCDGVYEEATSYEIGEAVRNHGESCSLETLARDLVDSSYHAGSTDNISVILVKIPAAPQSDGVI